MRQLPPAFLGCPKCEALVDLSPAHEDEDRLICGECGHDIGAYGNVKHRRLTGPSNKQTSWPKPSRPSIEGAPIVELRGSEIRGKA